MFFAFMKGLTVVLAVLTLTCLLFIRQPTPRPTSSTCPKREQKISISPQGTHCLDIILLIPQGCVGGGLTTARNWDESGGRNSLCWKLEEEPWELESHQNKSHNKVYVLQKLNLALWSLCMLQERSGGLHLRTGQTYLGNRSQTGRHKAGNEMESESGGHSLKVLFKQWYTGQIPKADIYPTWAEYNQLCPVVRVQQRRNNLTDSVKTEAPEDGELVAVSS